MHNKKFLVPFICCCYMAAVASCYAQKKSVQSDTMTISAKEWSKDENKQVHYSDWKTFSAITVDRLKNFSPAATVATDKYEGSLAKTYRASGFFRTEKIDGRWWVIDPLGHPFVVTAVNSIRPGKSANNELALTKKFNSEQDWMKATIDTLRENGFNTAGSWSDTEKIIAYNRYAEKPFAYTTQLNILGGYASAQKKADKSKKGITVLSYILDEGFATYCDEQAKKLSAFKNDPNLLGHFSDNELPFTHTEFKEILALDDHSNKCRMAAEDWMKNNQIDEKSISKEQIEKFMGWLAGKYYETVSKAIKKYDPNHLYIGSRLHSSAIKNENIFKAAAPYLDILSMNYYGNWQPQAEHIAHWASWADKPFFLTEFYTKAEATGMANISGAGWIVHTQTDRGVHYQNFCLQLLKAKNCVGWHWFKYQDNDPNDATADPSNKDSNKGIADTHYDYYDQLLVLMKALNQQKYPLIQYFDGLQ